MLIEIKGRRQEWLGGYSADRAQPLPIPSAPLY